MNREPSNGLYPDRPTLNNAESMLIKLSSIGLSQKDTIVMKALLKLSPELVQNFVLLPPKQISTASIVFINADNPSAVFDWEKLKKVYPHIIPIMIYRDSEPSDIKYSIRLPLNIKRLSATLKVASNDNTSAIKTEPDNAFLNVLVVDDSLSVRKYMETKLITLYSEQALRLDFAESGEQAITYIKESNNYYDLVFLDVMMEDLDGYQVCRWIKSVRRDTAIVMLTNRDSLIDKMRGSMSGCDAYLGKPPKDDSLREILDNLTK